MKNWAKWKTKIVRSNDIRVVDNLLSWRRNWPIDCLLKNHPIRLNQIRSFSTSDLWVSDLVVTHRDHEKYLWGCSRSSRPKTLGRFITVRMNYLKDLIKPELIALIQSIKWRYKGSLHPLKFYTTAGKVTTIVYNTLMDSFWLTACCQDEV